MNYTKMYSKAINNLLQKNKNVYYLLKLGIFIGKNYVKFFPDKRLPKSLRYLHQIAFDWTYRGITSKRCVWVNLFAPAEILLAFNLDPIFVEAISAFLSGLELEDELILRAESFGISESFCSFHKVFIGAILSNLLRKPKFLLATSSICDANLNTFRFISESLNLPFFFLDIPREYSKEAKDYLKLQLKELISFVEKMTGDKLDLHKLSRIIEIENKVRSQMKECLKLLGKKQIPTTLTFEMFMLYTSHTFIGKEETLRFYKMLVEDLKSAKEKNKKGVFFIHTLPMFEDNFKNLFNFSKNLTIIGMDLNYDFLEELPADDPIEALSIKLLKNPYNSDFEKRIEHLKNLIALTSPDAVIQVCQMGCKQSIGGSMLLKEEFKKLDIPFTFIDVDCVNKKNNNHGQIKTRLEAFFESIK
ncbi:2-hydroxyacyl-CoA dehydratase subunit D [Anaerocellum danielii]|uniref:2-hydroxyacyl-CoA dehydratase family protein n=1 Tax=Anaerocellum danielii TaxID=1387557 RepID=A0ABZ0TZ58_9FIRM|nr:2-hydroxyacyl-CoA dehydratase family protein [Caldicellulosiruptor danielii]WPX08695.1 2-hydroxyacyl-CoA dehydratase family protein [Caldicellulosiruptor danielii]